ncbi:ATP--cobalamin adenosyltransferase [Bacterioplanes sanyensis]|uniref:cob(I)yrinic acid a,c-diamide adenosyltransferase n=1 Tax=Bacterioplanes sanyensis TaxID=1249553 RepID=UPI001675B624|nr:cob(I)yrinic acid a,c-diamide adenosyltransferase [Bacterioplanes sanyensis]GGY34428.1 ATP--cobalamin adenosyltransferase [Bacterioplanes sanyensis]
MGNRLSKISTKTGDQGETGLGDGSRVSKSSLRIQAIGDVDELNSWIGLLRTELTLEDSLQALLDQVQHDLFDLGGELAVPGFNALSETLIADLEAELELLNRELPPLKDFILPGGSKAAAQCHMARAVCRRAERALVALQQQDEANPLALQYLNRLSDLLFVAARALARRDGGQEVLWRNRYQAN